MKNYPRSTYRMQVKPQYRNMKQVIDRHPEIVEYAVEAIRRAGLKPAKTSIRGGPTARGCRSWACPAQHLCRRTRLPLAAGMGQPAGHGKGRADHRASGDDLGGAGLGLPPQSRTQKAANKTGTSPAMTDG